MYTPEPLIHRVGQFRAAAMLEGGEIAE